MFLRVPDPLPPLTTGEGRRRLLRLVTTGAAQALLGVGAAHLVRTGFDGSTAAGTDTAALVALLAGVVALTALAAFLRRFERIEAERFAQDYVHGLRERILARVFRLDPTRVTGGPGGVLLVRTTSDLSAVAAWLRRGVARAMVNAVAIGGTLAVLLLVDPLLAGAALLAVATVALLARAEGRDVGPAVRRLRRRRGRFAALLHDRLQGLFTVEAFAHERGEARRLARASRRLAEAAVERGRALAALAAVGEAGALASPGVVVLAGILAVRAGWSTPGTVVAGVVLSGLLAPRVRELARLRGRHAEARVAFERIARLLAAPVPRRRGRRDLPDGAGRLVVADLGVEGRLRGVSFTAEPGARVVVTGPSGAGKTTLLLVAAGVLVPDAGRVEIDGVPVHALRPRARRRAVAAAGEAFPLLAGTLRENLLYGCDGPVHDERILELLEALGLAGRVRRAGGLDARVAAGGRNFSRGERMRLTLARALLARPRVLLADEPEAGLDEPARAAVRRVLEDFPGTLVVATHEPDAWPGVALRVRLEAGRLRALDGAPEGQVVAFAKSPKTEERR